MLPKPLPKPTIPSTTIVLANQKCSYIDWEEGLYVIRFFIDWYPTAGKRMDFIGCYFYFILFIASFDLLTYFEDIFFLFFSCYMLQMKKKKDYPL